MAEGLLQGLLKTPQQVREEQLLRMQQQAVAGRQLQSPLRASSALPGIFSNVLAQQAPALATDVAQAARGITQGVGGMLGAVGQQGLGQAVAGATISPEERQAAQAQQALQGTKLQDPASLEAAAAKLQQIGNVNAANALIARAQEIRQKQAELQLTQQKSMSELAQQAQRYAAANYDKERIITEIQTRNPTISRLQAQQAAEVALAEQRRATALRTTQLLPGELMQQTADLEKTREQTAEVQSQIQLNKERLSSLNSTEFMKELNATDLSEEDKKRLIEERVRTRARTGGVSGVGNKVIEAKLTSYTNVIAAGDGAEVSVRQVGDMLRVLPDASVGFASGMRGYAAEIGASLGIPAAERTAFANQLLDVISGKITLEAASAIKGALSDKDLAFLIKQAPRGELRPQTVQKLFSDLYKERYAENMTAIQFDKELGTLSDEQLRTYNVSDRRSKMMELYRLEAQQRLAKGVY
jgi:hypothetical protein